MTGELVKTLGREAWVQHMWGLCYLRDGCIAYSELIGGIRIGNALPVAKGGQRGSKGRKGKTRKSRKGDHKSRTRNKKRETRRSRN